MTLFFAMIIGSMITSIVWAVLASSGVHRAYNQGQLDPPHHDAELDEQWKNFAIEEWLNGHAQGMAEGLALGRNMAAPRNYQWDDATGSICDTGMFIDRLA